ncbi:MAG: integration host factor subunit beta [Treponema sp.]|nr:integration host factor subunit beta [Treponema sp.]
MEKITKAELVEEVYQSTNLPKNEISLIADSLLTEIKNALCKGSSIELRKFGTFELRLRKGRKNSRNPKTGKLVQVEPHYVVAFRAGKELKEKIWKIEPEK